MSSITKLRSKVVDIEAMQFTGGRENASEIVAWVIANGGFAIWWPVRTHDTSEDAHGREVTTKRTDPLPEHIEVDTLDSKGRVFVGDWMFRGLKGEFYPCKDDTKTEKYDEIEEI